VNFSFNPRTGRYFNKDTGRFVKRSDVIKSVDAIASSAKSKLQYEVRKLARGKITVDRFQSNAAKILKDSHLQSAMLGAGGKGGMTPRIRGFVGGTLSNDYNRLNKMAVDLKAGKITRKQALSRMSNYGESVRSSFFTADKESQIRTGRRFAKRLLTPGVQHCPECINYERREWTPIEDIIPVGVACSCRGRCRCVVRYQNA